MSCASCLTATTATQTQKANLRMFSLSLSRQPLHPMNQHHRPHHRGNFGEGEITQNPELGNGN
uniref:Uncharacterized protein n=1 Tax=Cucumis melo TaxID=3656 RepID=A0A9I9EFA9_CUCME